jgi:hypothetical protein
VFAVGSVHAKRAAEHVDRDPARRLVLGNSSTLVERVEDEPHRPVVKQCDLSMTVGGMSFGAQRSQLGTQIERFLVAGHSARGMRAEALFSCAHTDSPEKDEAAAPCPTTIMTSV